MEMIFYMDFTIPRNNESELVLYIWKIINLPSISKSDLLYKISFELFILPPEKAIQFIDLSVKKNLLTKDELENLFLSQNLKKKLSGWQAKRKKEIAKKMKLVENRIDLEVDINKSEAKSFKTLLKAFIDKGTLNRAATVSDSAFNIKKYDLKEGIVKVEVTGSRSKTYNVEINTKNQTLVHDCHDFQQNRVKNKKFCKHLVKLFFLLKEKNESKAVGFLSNIAKDINNWEFSD